MTGAAAGAAFDVQVVVDDRSGLEGLEPPLAPAVQLAGLEPPGEPFPRPKPFDPGFETDGPSEPVERGSGYVDASAGAASAGAGPPLGHPRRVDELLVDTCRRHIEEELVGRIRARHAQEYRARVTAERTNARARSGLPVPGVGSPRASIEEPKWR